MSLFIKQLGQRPSELTNSAVVVLFASLLIALVVFVMDFVFQNVMEFIYP